VALRSSRCKPKAKKKKKNEKPNSQKNDRNMCLALWRCAVSRTAPPPNACDRSSPKQKSNAREFQSEPNQNAGSNPPIRLCVIYL